MPRRPDCGDHERLLPAARRYCGAAHQAELEELIRYQRFRNSRYIVVRRHIAVTDVCGPLIHLSIRWVNGEPADVAGAGTFETSSLGPGRGSVELYPRRSQEVNSVHQHCFWVVTSDRSRASLGLFTWPRDPSRGLGKCKQRSVGIQPASRTRGHVLRDTRITVNCGTAAFVCCGNLG
jgi:hypothetical protein